MSTTNEEPSNEAYYQNLRQIAFGDTDWRWLYRRSLGNGRPKATFRLHQTFNDLSSFVVFDFIVDLHQLFGREVVPITIESGCTNIVTEFESPLNFSGIDFRYLMLTDASYHDIWRRYEVERIFLTSFPFFGNADKYDKFGIDEAGKPHPI